MSKFQRFMYLMAMAHGAELPYDLVREVVYG